MIALLLLAAAWTSPEVTKPACEWLSVLDQETAPLARKGCLPCELQIGVAKPDPERIRNSLKGYGFRFWPGEVTYERPPAPEGRHMTISFDRRDLSEAVSFFNMSGAGPYALEPGLEKKLTFKSQGSVTLGDAVQTFENALTAAGLSIKQNQCIKLIVAR